MKTRIEIYLKNNPEDCIFACDDCNTINAPLIGEHVFINNHWYKVADRTFAFTAYQLLRTCVIAIYLE